GCAHPITRKSSAAASSVLPIVIRSTPDGTQAYSSALSAATRKRYEAGVAHAGTPRKYRAPAGSSSAAEFSSRHGAFSRIPDLLRARGVDDAQRGEYANDVVRRIDLEPAGGELGAHPELVMVVLEELTRGEKIEHEG